MPRSIKPGLLIVALIVAAPAAAQDWRVTSNDGHGFAQIDFASISRTGDQARFWLKTTFKSPSGSPLIDTIIVYYEASCSSRNYVSLKSRNNYRGQTVESFGRETSHHAEPGTTIYYAIEAACGLR